MRNLSLAVLCALTLILTAGCGGSSNSTNTVDPTNVLYVQTNNPTAGENAVIAYKRDPSTGALTELGTYPTGGTGFYNTAPLGPKDHDGEIAATPNREFMFVVNQGSNDISSFKIKANGTLDLVAGTPVSSGGTQPISLAVVGNRLYVANRGDGTSGASYSGFTIGSGGSLTPIPGSTITVAAAGSPSQITAALGGHQLFGNEFAFSTGNGQIDTLTINSDGSLTDSSTAMLDSMTYNPPLTLGLLKHPKQKILYSGIPLAGVVGVWTYNNNGVLTFSGQEQASMVSPESAICWIAIDPKDRYLYTSSVGPDIVGVLSIDKSDPTKVTRIQDYAVPAPDAGSNASSPFNIAVAPSGKFLYTLNDCVPGATCTYNGAVHVMAIASDGTVSQTSYTPITLTGVSSFHPIGLLVY